MPALYAVVASDRERSSDTRPPFAAIWVLCLVPLGLVVASSPSVAAGSDFEKFQKGLAKVAATATKVQGLFCVCRDNSMNSDRAGVLAEGAVTTVSGTVAVALTCNVLQFDGGTGAFYGSTACTPWELLPR